MSSKTLLSSFKIMLREVLYWVDLETIKTCFDFHTTFHLYGYVIKNKMYNLKGVVLNSEDCTYST